MALGQNDVKWFRSLWLRVTIAVALAIWLVMELVWSQDMFWATMVGVVLAYYLYNYIYAFPKEDAAAETVRPPADDNDRADH